MSPKKMPVVGTGLRYGDPPTIEAPPRADMVHWYDPRQLLRTAASVVVSTVFGRHSDARLLEALNGPEEAESFDYVGQVGRDGSFWFDYVADTGDGWNSTFAIASTIAQSDLSLDNNSADPKPLPQGSVLVLGGDQVYPVADRAAYQERLENVYRLAFGHVEKSPDVFAIPGNHDWYDSLVAFSRLFCTCRKFGTCQTRQSRSYFALKLPHNWWLLGVDIQLNSDIDAVQVKYFRRVIEEEMDGDARIILCTPEPHWILAGTYGRKLGYDESNLAFLENQLIKDKGKVLVYIAGDLHHYQRYEKESNGVQKITSGGGGAFLHPTHGSIPRELPDHFVRQISYPSEKQSRNICWRNLMFLFHNPSFGLIPAILFLFTAWIFPVDLTRIDSLGEVGKRVLWEIVTRPMVAAWFLLVLLGFVLFTDTHAVWYRWMAGLAHGTANLLGAFLAKWLAQLIAIGILGSPYERISQYLLAGLVIFILGWIIGSFIMGAYLVISLNCFGRHANEAFSSLRIQDHKHFIRMCIEPNGDLTIYAIAIDRVPRRWSTAAGVSHPVSADPKATKPRLIEKISLRPDERPGRAKSCRVKQDLVRRSGAVEK